MVKKKVVSVIPARMGSTRFPGKPLVNILDLPMIEHVRRRAEFAQTIDEVYVATCDREIKEAVEKHGGKAIMTSVQHERCTDRVAQAAKFIDGDIFVIVQGDEPLIEPEMLDKVVSPLLKNQDLVCTNLISIIENSADLANPDIVKTFLDQKKIIMYYGRSPLVFFGSHKPYPVYRQTGLSAFTKSFLKTFSALAPTPMEMSESIDFLRILESGYRIQGVIHQGRTIGVDRPMDISKIEALLRQDKKHRMLYEQTIRSN